MELPKTIRNYNSPFGWDFQLAVSPQICEQSTEIHILPYVRRPIPRRIKSFKSTWNFIRQSRTSRCGLLHVLDHVYQGTSKWPRINPGLSGGSKWEEYSNQSYFQILCFELFIHSENHKTIVEILGWSEILSTFVSLHTFLIKVRDYGANSFFLGLSLIFLQWAFI